VWDKFEKALIPMWR